MATPPDKRTLERLRSGLAKLEGHTGDCPAHAEILEFAAAVGEEIGVTVDLSARATLGQAMLVLRPRDGPPPEFASLTKRELEVAQLVAKGLRNKEIAGALGISIATVKDHVHRILTKAGLEGRVEVAALWADP